MPNANPAWHSVKIQQAVNVVNFASVFLDEQLAIVNCGHTNRIVAAVLKPFQACMNDGCS
jgi:hypothetical protein